MNNIMEMKEIENKIYEINGVEVMLDSDLAILYNIETKRINEAVKNNPEKFPKRYSFILENEEKENLWSKFSTANISNMSRVNPRVFTEQGIYMLATILKSKEAVQVSIRIMDTFVRMRHFINFNKNTLPNKMLLLESRVDQNTKRIDELFDKFNPKDITKDKIIFEEEIYDAYSFIMDIFNSTKEEIIIIDNYAGKELLDIIKSINKKVYIVSSEIDNILSKKYSKEYSNITFIQNNSFHDRFIILDRKVIYTSGASFKDLGKKCSSISKIRTEDLAKTAIEKFLKIIDLI